MAQRELSDTVVVLDLDDTLYKEADYQDSGLREICDWIESLYGKDIRENLFVRKNEGEKDLLGAACALTGLPPTVKESLLWVYRLHRPNIQLNSGTREALSRIQASSKMLAILTDGRSVSQRLKLKVLGLAHLPVYISEEFASAKPMPERFNRIMSDWPAQHYIYVGDNPAKDFVAPNKLGWTTFCLRGDSRNVHAQDPGDYPLAMAPSKWITDLSEILD